jgi:hypothetical protein
MYSLTDFTIQLKNIPKHYNTVELKAELWNWFDSLLLDKNQDRAKLDRKTRIVDIQFGLNDYLQYETLLKIKKQEKKLIKLRLELIQESDFEIKEIRLSRLK